MADALVPVPVSILVLFTLYIRTIGLSSSSFDPKKSNVLYSIITVQGVNIPNTTLQLPSMTEKDKEDILWGIRSNEIDIVAASFVRKASDVRTVKAYLERCISRAKADGDLKEGDDVVRPAIISKIENKEGVDNFEEILAESDGIMVARGGEKENIPGVITKWEMANNYAATWERADLFIA